MRTRGWHAGNSGRLLEMLHGSDGWGKLVSELQQREEEEAARQQTMQEGEEQQQQPPVGGHRKRGNTTRNSTDPKPTEHR